MIALFFVLLCGEASAQKLLEKVEQAYQDTTLYTLASFKATRIAIGQSVETRKKGILEIHLNNRFWNTPADDSQSFVADRMGTRFGLEYAISDRFTMGAGGSTWDGIFDGFAKYRLLWQREGKGGSPVSVTLFQNASYRSKSFLALSPRDDFSSRMSYTSQLAIARKFNSNFTLQLTPTLVNRGNLLFPEDPQAQFALGLGGRYKLGNHVSVVSEYYHVFDPITSVDTYGAFALGVNWEMTDVILQFGMTNARSMVEDSFITQTRNNFNFRDPNFHFGFNFTYILHLSKK